MTEAQSQPPERGWLVGDDRNNGQTVVGLITKKVIPQTVSELIRANMILDFNWRTVNCQPMMVWRFTQIMKPRWVS